MSEAFGITRERDNGKNMTDANSDLVVIDDGFADPPVLVTPRIGITKSIADPLRYIIAGNDFVSGKKIALGIVALKKKAG